MGTLMDEVNLIRLHCIRGGHAVLIISKEYLYVGQLDEYALIITKIPTDDYKRVLIMENRRGVKHTLIELKKRPKKNTRCEMMKRT